MLESAFSGLEPLAMVFLRLAVGIILIVHGIPKLFSTQMGPRGFAGYLQSLKVPAPLFFAVVVALVEFLGGIGLIVGLLTRWAALFVSIEFIVAILLVGPQKGFTKGALTGYEFDVTILAGALALLILGAGSISLDGVIGVSF